MSNRFPSAVRRGVAFLALAVTAASCTGATIVKDYGPEAKANFVQACHVDTLIDDGNIVTTTLAPRNTCECIYTAMKDEFQLSWDALSDYEAAVADAPAGDPPPMPVKLQKSIDSCTKAGPSAPKATTTTEPAG